MSTRETTTLLAQLRAVLALTNTEIQIADTRIAQARTEVVRQELSANAERARARAAAVEAAIRELGGVPEVIGPFLGRAVAAVKALADQAQPFEEALLGDLTLEHQLLDRARYIKALATTAGQREVVGLADRLITAHTETVDWLTTVLAEDALGGPAALRPTLLQAATGTAVRLFNLPVDWSARGLDRALDTVRATGPALGELLAQGGRAGDVAVKTFTASRDAALATAEQVTRREGADTAADALRSVRGGATGVLDPDELPISDYPELNLTQAAAAIKELTNPTDIHAILTYEQANKNRQGVLTAARNRLTTIAKDITGLT
ncbi:ferritin-like domain-containing protein [Nocardia gipuzkoensis]|uniref:ferritin-like domain-containing protein n=1 Tax=Nocardia gipuzkoensis TaxID=2749991 RepID=UPI00237DC51A|nr:ferritin-like domain-containing protein [Nocardia gipuzkoensis]MDE1672026.1 ferritin-like domain-containing protein [Nocardia gipuzkoensis]